MSTIMKVQRAWAILLLTFIGVLPVAPVFAKPTHTAQLPVCCRAQGKHNCAMRQARAHSSVTEPAIYSVCGQFPLLPPVSSTAVNPSVFLPKASQLFFAAIPSHPVIQEQTEARYRISLERSRQKRGPPFFLA